MLGLHQTAPNEARKTVYSNGRSIHVGAKLNQINMSESKLLSAVPPELFSYRDM